MKKMVTQLNVTIPDGAPPGSILSIPLKGRVEPIRARVPVGLGPGNTLVLTQREGLDEWVEEVPDDGVPCSGFDNGGISEVLPSMEEWDSEIMPDGPVAYTVRLDTTAGVIDIIVRPDWAPHGARRFLELAAAGDLDGLSFYRSVKGCLAQFGLPAKRSWPALPDDPPTGVPFLLGAVCFAAAGANSRKSTLFICIGDMSHCFGQSPWETPIGAVAESSLDALDCIETIYGDIAECGGAGPDTGQISAQGDAYLRSNFPLLTYITSARPLDWPAQVGVNAQVTAEVAEVVSVTTPIPGQSCNTSCGLGHDVQVDVLTSAPTMPLGPAPCSNGGQTSRRVVPVEIAPISAHRANGLSVSREVSRAQSVPQGVQSLPNMASSQPIEVPVDCVGSRQRRSTVKEVPVEVATRSSAAARPGGASCGSLTTARWDAGRVHPNASVRGSSLTAMTTSQRSYGPPAYGASAGQIQVPIQAAQSAPLLQHHQAAYAAAQAQAYASQAQPLLLQQQQQQQCHSQSRSPYGNCPSYSGAMLGQQHYPESLASTGMAGMGLSSSLSAAPVVDRLGCGLGGGAYPPQFGALGSLGSPHPASSPPASPFAFPGLPGAASFDMGPMHRFPAH